MSHQKRIDLLTERLKNDGLSAVMLIPGPSLFYLTGLSFHLMERPIITLLSGEAEPRMVIPELEQLKAESSQVNFELYTYGEEEGAALKALERAVSGLNLDGGKVGIEPLSMRYFELSLLDTVAPASAPSPADNILSGLRMIKGSDEIAAMQRAAEIAQEALQKTLPLIQVGMTEIDLASELTAQLLKAGSEPEMPFAPIVASGPNSALGHATPSDRPLTPSDSLVLDWGAAHRGYVSDITRTFFVGEAPEELGQIHETVQRANAAGRAAVRPGVSCGSIDLASRSEIQAAGYGEYFIHRTGHGLGLEGHEPPYIREGEPSELKAGMTFTVEPGIYLPGRGGVRVEDDIAVTDDGGISLTTFPREAEVVG